MQVLPRKWQDVFTKHAYETPGIAYCVRAFRISRPVRNTMISLHFFAASILLIQAWTLYAMTTQGVLMSELQATVDALTAQVGKIGDEVKAASAALSAELADVRVQLANAGAYDKVDLTGLAAAIQAVDDINPDAAPEVPAE